MHPAIEQYLAAILAQQTPKSRVPEIILAESQRNAASRVPLHLLREEQERRLRAQATPEPSTNPGFLAEMLSDRPEYGLQAPPTSRVPEHVLAESQRHAASRIPIEILRERQERRLALLREEQERRPAGDRIKVDPRVGTNITDMSPVEQFLIERQRRQPQEAGMERGGIGRQRGIPQFLPGEQIRRGFPIYGYETAPTIPGTSPPGYPPSQAQASPSTRVRSALATEGPVAAAEFAKELYSGGDMARPGAAKYVPDEAGARQVVTGLDAPSPEVPSAPVQEARPRQAPTQGRREPSREELLLEKLRALRDREASQRALWRVGEGLHQAGALAGTTAGHYMAGRMPRTISEPPPSTGIERGELMEEYGLRQTMEAQDPSSETSIRGAAMLEEMMGLPQGTLAGRYAWGQLSEALPSITRMVSTQMAAGIEAKQEYNKILSEAKQEYNKILSDERKSFYAAGSRPSKIRDMLAHAEGVLSQLQAGNIELVTALARGLAKASGEGSRMSDYDVQSFLERPGYKKLVDKVGMFFKGEPTEGWKAAAEKLAQQYVDFAKEQLQREVDARADGIQNIYGIPAEQVRQALLGTSGERELEEKRPGAKMIRGPKKGKIVHGTEEEIQAHIDSGDAVPWP